MLCCRPTVRSASSVSASRADSARKVFSRLFFFSFFLSFARSYLPLAASLPLAMTHAFCQCCFCFDWTPLVFVCLWPTAAGLADWAERLSCSFKQISEFQDSDRGRTRPTDRPPLPGVQLCAFGRQAGFSLARCFFQSWIFVVADASLRRVEFDVCLSWVDVTLHSALSNACRARWESVKIELRYQICLFLDALKTELGLKDGRRGVERSIDVRSFLIAAVELFWVRPWPWLGMLKDGHILSKTM